MGRIYRLKLILTQHMGRKSTGVRDCQQSRRCFRTQQGEAICATTEQVLRHTVYFCMDEAESGCYDCFDDGSDGDNLQDDIELNRPIASPLCDAVGIEQQTVQDRAI